MAIAAEPLLRVDRRPNDIPNIRDFLPENAPQPEIWVAGYPSFVGGADTEMDHQITLWRESGVEVHLCPVDGFNPEHHDPRMVESVVNRGCHVHQYEHGIFAGKLVFALCNDQVLKKAAEIALSGRPASLVWGNCMTWTMEAEKNAHSLGLIDLHCFQSDYQKKRLMNELEQVNGDVATWEDYHPWFDWTRFPMREKTTGNYFGVGRISRDDSGKFHPLTWRMFGKVCAPLPVKAFVLGFGENIEGAYGKPDDLEKGGVPWLDYMLWSPGGETVNEFFQRIDVLIHITANSRENWPRCVMEAWANGVIPITDNDWGLVEMIEDGVNGFRVGSPEEASYRASQLAFDLELRREMQAAGLREIRQKHGDAVKAVRSWAELFCQVFNWS